MGLEAFRSRTRLGLASDMALEAKEGEFVSKCLLLWALGLPLYNGVWRVWKEEACTFLTLGARLATALDSTIIVLFILESLALS